MLSNIVADFGTFAGDITRTVEFSNFRGDVAYITQLEAIGAPPAPEVVSSSGTGLTRFSDIEFTLGNVSRKGIDWGIEVSIQFSSACGATTISFLIIFNENAVPFGCNDF